MAAFFTNSILQNDWSMLMVAKTLPLAFSWRHTNDLPGANFNSRV
ncbi:Uncharacterised protein [Segatella copri]|nr:Uncharacterised protein [Segatella copri]